VNKRIVLKIGPGTLDTGYVAAVQIGEEGLPPQIETHAHLSPAADLPDLYRRWQQSYRQLGLPYRLEAHSGITNVSDVSALENCRVHSRQLRDRLHHWLNGHAFRPIREKILEQLSPQDTARILLQTQDPLLQRLPWYELQFFERYPRAEVAICSPNYEKISRPTPRSNKVRILAVLGNATGLNLQSDQALLNNLDADIHYLKEPSRETFNRCLWETKGWDILFFAGHSNSEPDCTDPHLEGSGEMLLNATDKLTIPQLKHALKKAIERGLNTAIFNSCDGLGLAADLADLHIPQVLVMREPVPDPVAHAFLQGFLESFSAGSPFYVAVREAREKMQGLEARFPCATWLPVIVQNLAEIPPTWSALHQNPSHSRSAFALENRLPPLPDLAQELIQSRASLLAASSALLTTQKRWKVGIGSGLLIAAALLFGRQFGLLQSVELKAYDLLLRSRPTEAIDSRLLIITNTEADIAARPNKTGNSSLSDETLLALLNKLTPLDPQLIGLDIYRTQPAITPELAQQLEGNDRLIAICKAEDHTVETTAFAPPLEIKDMARVGASDFVDDDSDKLLRRHLLAFAPPADSPCQAKGTFSTVLALHYLEEVHNIPRSDGDYLGPALLPRISRSSFGGYRQLKENDGYQILLNYRILDNPQQTKCNNVVETPADCLTVTDVLQMDASQLSSSVAGRIVLIGTTAVSSGDRWLTPYTQSPSIEGQAPGVFLQAQMVSQLLSAALEDRPLLTSWPEWQEIIWISSWALLGALIGAYAYPYRGLKLWLQLLLSEGALLLTCWLFLVNSGIWVPWVPSAIALPAAAIASQSILKLNAKTALKSN
jgi:CHASE2 domain-containing sensor protein